MMSSTMSTEEPVRPRGTFWVRLFFTLLFCGIGLSAVVTQRANFQLGRSRSMYANKYVHQIDASGIDAIAIGVFIIAIGVINLSLGIEGPRRIPVFWLGVTLFAAPVLYALGKSAVAIYELIQIATS
jgi:hypothetical protein